MGESLHQQGYTCLGVRLAGHATHPEDMVRSRWTDWTASVEDGYNLLCRLTDDIFLVGLSMGGVIALLLSTQLTPRVMGVVAMSTPFRLPSDYPVWMMRLFSKFMKFRSKTKEQPGSGWFDQTAYVDHVSYPRNPVYSAAELKLLILEMHKALPRVDVPVLLTHSQDDKYVLPKNVERIYDRLGKALDKTKLYVTGSGHVLPRDAARQQVFHSTLEFIQRIESSKGQN